MSPLFRKSAKEGATKTIAIVDIGTSSIGVALVQLDRNGPPTVLAHHRALMPVPSARPHSVTLGKQTLESLRGAMQCVELQQAEHVAVFLPAPWAALNLRTLRLAPQRQFRADSKLFERMIADAVTEGEPPAPTDEIIEHSALGIRLNGYAVTDIPKETAVESAELTIVSVSAPHALLSHLREEMRANTGLRHQLPITFHSTSVAAAYALSVVLPESGDYLLCNTEGELIECLLVVEHAPHAAATAPVGCNTIFRTLRAHADMARAEASTALALARKPSSPMGLKLKTTLDAAKRECAKGFRAAVQNLLASASSTPRIIYSLGHGSEGLWFADAIAGTTALKKLFPSGVGVKHVSMEMLGSHIAGGGSRDMFLALEAIFCDARFDAHRSFNFKIRETADR